MGLEYGKRQNHQFPSYVEISEELLLEIQSLRASNTIITVNELRDNRAQAPQRHNERAYLRD